MTTFEEVLHQSLFEAARRFLEDAVTNAEAELFQRALDLFERLSTADLTEEQYSALSLYIAKCHLGLAGINAQSALVGLTNANSRAEAQAISAYGAKVLR